MTVPITEHIIDKLSPIGIGSPSVTILQPLGQQRLLVQLEHALPDGMLNSILKTISKAAGPNVTVELAKDDKDNAQIVAVKGAYRLALVPAHHGPMTHLSTMSNIIKVQQSNWQAAAHKASPRFFKEGVNPSIPFKVVPGIVRKSIAAQDWERIVTGVVLEPEVVDGTKTDESLGDIYSEEEIKKAMYFWMENALGSFSYHHVEQGGNPLSAKDIALIENWQARQDEVIGEQTIRKGSWVQTNRVCRTEKGDKLWQDILNGHINSWSIGAMAMGKLEEIDSPTIPAGESL